MEGALERDGIKLAYLPSPGSVRIRLTAEGQAVDQLKQAHTDVLERLSEWVVSEEGLPVQEALSGCLVRQGLTLAVAESCTGGALGAALVARAGASAFFRGGVQSYSNAAKVQLLEVDEALISEHGAVSEAVAKAMAKGVCAKSLGRTSECPSRALPVLMEAVRISPSAPCIWLVTALLGCCVCATSSVAIARETLL